MLPSVGHALESSDAEEGAKERASRPAASYDDANTDGA